MRLTVDYKRGGLVRAIVPISWLPLSISMGSGRQAAIARPLVHGCRCPSRPPPYPTAQLHFAGALLRAEHLLGECVLTVSLTAQAGQLPWGPELQGYQTLPRELFSSPF